MTEKELLKRNEEAAKKYYSKYGAKRKSKKTTGAELLIGGYGFFIGLFLFIWFFAYITN